MNAIEISIEGMSCNRCASRVQRTLTALDGVGDAEVSLEERRVIVRFDRHHIAVERLVSAIDDAGFKAGSPSVPQ